MRTLGKFRRELLQVALNALPVTVIVPPLAGNHLKNVPANVADHRRAAARSAVVSATAARRRQALASVPVIGLLAAMRGTAL